MSTVLSAYTNSRDNNFNLLRFIAALLVLYSHSFALASVTSSEPLHSIIGMTWGRIAVDTFFVTSGFLVTGSYFQRNNLFVFAWARVLRIYPALIAAVLFCVFIVGLGFTTLSAWEYITSETTLKFLAKNVILFCGVEYNLPGVFDNVPWKNSVNGSLWTLPYEVKMYVHLAFFLFIFGYIRRRQLNIGQLKQYLLFVAFIAIIANITTHFQWFPYIQSFIPAKSIRLFYMFFAGAAYYVWRENVLFSLKVFTAISFALLMSSFHSEVFFVFYIVFLPYLILFLAYVPSGKIRDFNKIGDYSYGIYIYAFPVQQSISAMIPGVSVATMIIVSILVTFFLSFLSWHLIEKRFLKMKELYVVFERLWVKKYA